MKEVTAAGAHHAFSMDRRIALVTGAAHGLGLGIVTAFAAAGARVVMFDRDEPALAEALELVGADSHAAYVGDVTQVGDVEAAVGLASERFGGLDVVVNNAAIYPTGLLDDVTDDEFIGVLDVNVAGYRRVVRAARGLLAAADDASVINMASITLFLGIPPGLSSYITSKGAVVGLTRALARELGPDGIRVNAIAPGAFPTRAEDIVEDRAAYDDQIIASQCLKRRGTVSDIACSALFLASAGSSFISGQTLAVDGGWTFS